MLYEPAQFEPLTDEPWDPAHIEAAIAAIVADADSAFDPEALWPAHEWDGWEEPLPLKSLYVGAAGVIWALDALRRRGHAETSLDLAAAALRTLELKRTAPDFAADEHYHPAALLCGETGPLLVAFRLGSDPALADELHILVRANVANPTDDVMWGAPGTLLAALAMGEWTGEPRWEEAARASAAALRARRGEDGLWRQDNDYRGLGTLHGASGNTLALLRLEADDALAAETAAVLTRHAFREDGLANWPGSPRAQLARPRDGRICLQCCTGAPGVLAGAWEYLDEELLLAGAELIWRAGAHGDEKGHGLCHGTSATGSHFSRRSRAPAMSVGSSVRAALPFTRSPRPSGSAPRTAGAATPSSPATSARHCSLPLVSTSTCATRSSRSSSTASDEGDRRKCGPRRSTSAWSNSGVRFDRHTLVLLVRRPDAPELTDEEAAELQDRHLAFRADLRDRGFLVGGGPLVDQDDERLRGISIMTCDPETARRLSNEDPAVQAGRLAVEVMTWMVPAGNVRFENVPAPRSIAEAAGD